MPEQISEYADDHWARIAKNGAKSLFYFALGVIFLTVSSVVVAYAVHMVSRLVP